MTPIDRHVGRRIRGKRRALGLTQDDLANAIGVGTDTIEDYERGNQRVPSEHIIKLSQYLGVPVSYFFPSGPCPSA
jgi:transcriptional regulator with XRE-family HTH domain